MSEWMAWGRIKSWQIPLQTALTCYPLVTELDSEAYFLFFLSSFFEVWFYLVEEVKQNIQYPWKWNKIQPKL